VIPERWLKIEELYHAALERDPGHRAAYLSEACTGDAELLHEVETLLNQPAEADRFLDEPALAEAAQIVSSPAGSGLTGQRIGAFQLQELLGAGGMGEVYRARDTKLGRDVAIKILPRLFTSDPERLSRFEREARMLAALNHPHIGAIYGVEEAEGVRGLVLELVEGVTLADRLRRGPVPLAEALTVARQIADAVETAHEKGIIHRDLKPANVKITPDGVVKVLDFGLAKAAAGDGSTPDSSQSPTVTIGGTRDGIILGTAAYMSPEQARGRSLDKRTDIWSFGCVLYEMLGGRAAFAADTLSDTIVAILEREPNWSTLPATTPPHVTRLLRRCLDKDPKLRLRDIGEARIVLDGSATTPEDVKVPAERPFRRRAPWGLAAALLVIGSVLGSVLATGLRAPMRALSPSGHFLLPLPASERLAGLDFPAVAISPDGSLIAYVATLGGQTRLMLRPMNNLQATPLSGSVNAIAPFFSPDNRWIGFFADGQLKKISTSGGSPVIICDAAVGLGGSWGTDETIVFAASTGSGLSQVSANGGKPRLVTNLATDKGEFSHRWPELLPDGKTVLYTVGTLGNWDDAQIVAQSLATGQRSVLIQGGTNPHYLASGQILYARGGAILAVPFDSANLKLTGTPVQVLDNILESADGAAQVAVSPLGNAVYVIGGLGMERRLVSVDRAGYPTPLAAPPKAYAAPRVSPDGRKLLVTIIDDATENVWLYDFATGTLNPVTSTGDTRFPIWTPDGDRATFCSGDGGPANLFWARIAEPESPERLSSSDNIQLPGSWSPDGQMLAFVERQPTSGRDIWLLRMKDRTAHPFVSSPYDESAPRFSPDGRWMAFVSNESGRNEVYVSPLTDGARKQQVSNDGGAEPVWGHNGRELFYRSARKMMAVSVMLSDNIRIGKSQTLFEGSFEQGTIDTANYDITSDQKRFLMVAEGEGASAQSALHVLINWSGPLFSTRSSSPR
jgi:Tol biopolymer transport system component